MIRHADDKRILSVAELKADDGCDFVARVQVEALVTWGFTWGLISTCIALFSGAALFGQNVQFQGSVPTGVASPTSFSLTLRDAIDRGNAN